MALFLLLSLSIDLPLCPIESLYSQYGHFNRLLFLPGRAGSHPPAEREEISQAEKEVAGEDEIEEARPGRRRAHGSVERALQFAEVIKGEVRKQRFSGSLLLCRCVCRLIIAFITMPVDMVH